MHDAANWNGYSLWVHNTDRHLREARRALSEVAPAEHRKPDAPIPEMTERLRDTWIRILKDAAINGRETVGFDDAALRKFHCDMVEHWQNSRN